MSEKEATARIKINKLLEASGWRFFPDGGKPANIRLEPGVTIKYSSPAFLRIYRGYEALLGEGVHLEVTQRS